jgi:glycosyltransferase involved in cell wall biosynthesis
MVNDCAYVGETILKYLPQNIEKAHIRRSRGLWSKTFGIAYKIWRAKADVYHVHYLLQDCYLSSLFGKKPLIGHAHGSDLINTLNRFTLGRLVKSNLRKCDKILVSTPDLLKIAQRYRQDVEYLPNPVDIELFYPKPLKIHERKLEILIASEADWALKGTDIIIQALARLKEKVDVAMISYGKDLEKTLALAKSSELNLKMLPRVPHQHLNNYYWNSDIVIGQGRFKTGALGLISLEAIASGRPVIANVSSKYEAYKDFPLKDVNNEEKIVEAFQTDLDTLWKAEYAYLAKNHHPQAITKRIFEIYSQLAEKRPGQ